MHQNPFHHFTQLWFCQLVLKETLSTRLGSRGVNRLQCWASLILHTTFQTGLLRIPACAEQKGWQDGPHPPAKGMLAGENIPFLTEKLVMMKDI